MYSGFGFRASLGFKVLISSLQFRRLVDDIRDLVVQASLVSGLPGYLSL